MLAPAASDDTLQTTGRFYAMVESLHKFDQQEVKGVIRTLLSTSERERCFVAGCRVPHVSRFSRHGDCRETWNYAEAGIGSNALPLTFIFKTVASLIRITPGSP